MRVFHLITSLNRGGAEMSLVRLLNNNGASNENVWVVTLLSSAGLEGAFASTNVKICHLRLDRPMGVVRMLRFLWSFVFTSGESGSSVVVCWMYHSCVLGMLLKLLTRGRTSLIWNVRQCLGDVRSESWSSRICLYLMRRFYKACDSLISNSGVALLQHIHFGIACSNRRVIPNGYSIIDSDVSEATSLREMCKVPARSLVIGHLARFHPVKDHITFCKALNLVFKQVDFAEAILVGKNILVAKPLLLKEIAPEYFDRIHFWDEIEDSSWGIKSFDIFCLTSLSEAFPNVLAEAMSHAIPCVATDVGEVRNLSTEGCFIVPPADPQALAKQLVQLAHLPKNERVKFGIINRQKIQENYSMSSVVRSYQNLFNQL